MKKIILISILLIALLSFVACESKLGKKEIDKNNLIEEENQKGNIKENEPIASAIIEKGTWWAKGMEEFQGIDSNYETLKYGNEEANIKLDSPFFPLRLLCSAPDSDVIYYANYGKDFYIYELKDGKSRLLVERKTNVIQLWKDELYFLDGLSDRKTGTVNAQNICKYNLETGEVTVVVEGENIDFFISENGLYYQQGILYQENEKHGLNIKQYRYDLDTEESKVLEGMGYLQYKEYQLISEYQKESYLKNTYTGETINVIPENLSVKASIIGDLLFYKYSTEIYIINLKTGKKYSVDFNEYYPLNNLAGEAYGYSNLEDFTVIGDNLYVVDGTAFIYCLNLTTKEVTVLKEYYSGGFHALYVSGQRLFAFCSNKRKKGIIEEHMVELVPSDSSNEFEAIKLNDLK